jgi:hypothetical protein
MQKCDIVVRYLYTYLGINTAHKLSRIIINTAQMFLIRNVLYKT